MLAAALVTGAAARAIGLGAPEMSADEGASWAAAAASTLGEVTRRQALFNPGKLAVHELALHAWIGIFGDGVGAMRMLSAALGSIAIVLVFALIRELFTPAAGRPCGRVDRGFLGALGALLFAVNLITVKYSREARMYPMLIDLTLLQVWCFIRAQRRGGLWNYLGAALFTALAMAAHFTAAFVVGAEGLWLIYLALAAGSGAARTRRIAAGAVWWRLAAALGLGVALLGPLLPAALRSSEQAVTAGAIDWIRPPPLWEPIAMFNKATGTFAFPMLAGLAGWGVVRGWSRAPEAVRFALVWMWGPVLMLMAVSYALKPLLLERYALSCFVPFFILAALGLHQIAAPRWRAGALALALALSLGHLAAHYRRPHDVQWREATGLAIAKARAQAGIAVAPDYAVNVVRYYLERDARRRGRQGEEAGSAGRVAQRRVIAMPLSQARAAQSALLIVGRPGVPADARARLTALYPRLVASLRGVEVRERPQAQ